MNNVKAIVLFGKGGTGKSTTLNEVIQKLLKNCDNAQKKDSSSKYSKYKDNAITMLYKGKTIGIITAGDNKDEIQKHLKRIKDIKCDLYIMASRNYGSSVDYIKKLFGNENIMWISKTFIDKKIKNDTDPCILEDAFNYYCDFLNKKQINIIYELINDTIEKSK